MSMNMETLKGYFLLATPQMPDPRFQEQVVYLCSHDDQGAMGFVINQPSAFNLLEIFRSANIEADPDREWPPLYVGGPVDAEAAFFLYRADGYESVAAIDVGHGLHISRDPRMIREIAAGGGPSDYLLLLGYAGWGPGQLERELTDNGWLTLPGDPEIIFQAPDAEKWKLAARKHGIDIELFADNVGTA